MGAITETKRELLEREVARLETDLAECRDQLRGRLREVEVPGAQAETNALRAREAKISARLEEGRRLLSAVEPANRATRKNIYVAADVRPIWERAEQLAGDSLSSLLTDLLRDYISTKQAVADGWEHLHVQVTDNPPSAPPTKAFWGRWVLVGWKLGADRTVSVAATRRGRLAFHHQDEKNGGSWLNDFDSLDQAANAYDRELLEVVAVNLGRAAVEELDI